MAVPKCSRLVCAIVLLASLILLAGTQQTSQGGVLWFAQTYPCSLLSALRAPAAPRPAETPAVLPLVTEDPATAAFAICLVIKDQAEDLREVSSPPPLHWQQPPAPNARHVSHSTGSVDNPQDAWGSAAAATDVAFLTRGEDVACRHWPCRSAEQNLKTAATRL